MANSRRGFTLLEVLVAVALLGLVVTVLAGSAIQGMSYEGDASRRMRASLLADRALWQVETAIKLGAPPQPSHEESVEGDEFQLSVDVQPLDLSAHPALAAVLVPPPESGAPPPEAAAAEAGVPGAVVPLFQIFVRVAWLEGLRELEVTRSSFAYDGAAAAAALGASEGEEAAPAEREAEPGPEAEEPE